MPFILRVEKNKVYENKDTKKSIKYDSVKVVNEDLKISINVPLPKEQPVRDIYKDYLESHADEIIDYDNLEIND